jgi:hypothetical protein
MAALNQIPLIANPNFNRSNEEHLTEYLSTANGAYRTMQIAERVIQVVLNVFKDLSQSTVSALKYAAGKLNVAWTMLSLPRIPSVIVEAKGALGRLFGFNKSNGSLGVRAVASDLNKLGDCGATLGFSAMGLLNNSPIAVAVKPFAEAADFVANATDLVPAADDLVCAYKYRTIAENNQVRNLEVERALTDTMKHSFLKLIKPIASVASVVFGFLALTYGGPVLPALAFITMGLVGSLASFAAHFFKETRPNQVINFSQIASPVVA